jgi:hypothetical protein
MSDVQAAVNRARLDEVFGTVQNFIEMAGPRIAKASSEVLVEEIKDRIYNQKGRWKALSKTTVRRKKYYKGGKFSENATKKWMETGGFVKRLKTRQTKEGADIFVAGNRKSKRSGKTYDDILAINEEVRPLVGPSFKAIKKQMQGIVDEALRKREAL